MPKLSYLVSSYDSGHFLDDHLADLQRQTDPDFEIIIVVPGSPGTDVAVGEKWAAKDSRITLVIKPEREPYGTSWLTAWEYSTGDFVVNSNTDDFHDPRFTEVFHREMSQAVALCSENPPRGAILRTGPPVGFGFAGITVRDERGRVTGRGIRPDFDLELFSRECHCGPQVCWRNDKSFRDSLDWDLMERRSLEHTSAFDYWLWLYFMSLGFKSHSIKELLTIYTQRADSIENRDKNWNNYETFSAIAEFFPHHFGTSLKGVDEFKVFSERPPKEEWVQKAREGKSWK